MAIADVPVVIFPSKNEDDILEALILSNRDTRQRTPEQEGREFLALKAIAERREGKGKAGRPKQEKLGVNSPPISSTRAETRRSSDIAAKQLKMSRQKGEHAAFAVQVMDALKADGKQAESQQIQHQFKKSVNKAYRAAKELQAQVQPSPLNGTHPNPATKYITLEAWETYSEKEQQQLIANAPRKGKQMNQQETDHIEWAQWSWNPVVGCLHNCPYCYARDIAERTYPNGFAPALVLDRLHAPRNIQVPAKAKTDIGYKNICPQEHVNMLAWAMRHSTGVVRCCDHRGLWTALL